MKRFSNLFLLLFILIFSCKKDEDTFPKNQNTIGNYLFENKKAKIDTAYSGGSYVMGFQFSSAKRGKINQLGIKSGAIGTYTISVVDSTSNQIIASDTIYQRSISLWAFKDIYPVTIETQKKYYIYTKNISLKPFFVVQRDSVNANLKFPLVIGDITVEHLIFSFTSSTPKIDTTTAFYGLVDFTFREDRY